MIKPIWLYIKWKLSKYPLFIFISKTKTFLILIYEINSPHDSRPARNSNNNNSNNNNGGNGVAGNSNSNNNTGNVLRSLGNTFVPNTSNHNSTTNSHVFG